MFQSKIMFSSNVPCNVYLHAFVESPRTNIYTVFDLISGLSAYVILGPKIALISEPPPLFFFFFFFFFFLALSTLSASIPGAKRYFRRSLHVRDRL